MKKYLIIDQGLRNALVKDYTLKENNKGFIIENLVGLTLALNFKNITYWKKQNYEVDFIADEIPIEVKYKNMIGKKDFIGLLKFLDSHKKTNGIVITKNKLGFQKIDGKTIRFVPFWLFLLSKDLKFG